MVKHLLLEVHVVALKPIIENVVRQPAQAEHTAYLDPVQQFAHAPEAVRLNIPQSLFLETGHVKVFHFLLWRRQNENNDRA